MGLANNRMSSAVQHAKKLSMFEKGLIPEEFDEYSKLDTKTQEKYREHYVANDRSGKTPMTVKQFIEHFKLDKKETIETQELEVSTSQEINNDDKLINSMIDGEPIEKSEPIDIPTNTIRDTVFKTLKHKKETGRSISVYLSSDALKKLKEYSKKEKLSPSNIIDALIKQIL